MHKIEKNLVLISLNRVIIDFSLQAKTFQKRKSVLNSCKHRNKFNLADLNRIKIAQFPDLA